MVSPTLLPSSINWFCSSPLAAVDFLSDAVWLYGSDAALVIGTALSEDLTVLHGHTARVVSVAAAALSSFEALVASTDGLTTRLWVVWLSESGVQCIGVHVLETEGSTAVALSKGLRLAVGDRKGRVSVWRWVDGKPVLQRSNAAVSSVAVCCVVAAEEDWAVGTQDGGLVVLEADGDTRLRLEGHSLEILSLSACRGLVASSSRDLTVRVWELESRALAREFTVGKSRKEKRQWVSVCWISEEELVFSDPDGRVYSCNCWSDKAGPAFRSQIHDKPVFGMAYAPGLGQLWTGSMDRSVGIWNWDSRKIARVVSGFGGEVLDLEENKSGDAVAIGCGDCVIRIWNGKGTRLRTVWRGIKGRVTAVRWYKGDGKFHHVLAFGTDIGFLGVYDTRKDKIFCGAHVHQGPLYRIQWVYDVAGTGEEIWTCGADGSFKRHRINYSSLKLGSSEDEAAFFSNAASEGHDSGTPLGKLTTFALSITGEWFALGFQSGQIAVFYYTAEAIRYRCTFTEQKGPIYQLVWTSLLGKQTLVAISNDGSLAVFLVHSTTEGACDFRCLQFISGAHYDARPILRMALLENARLLATCGNDGYIRIWEWNVQSLDEAVHPLSLKHTIEAHEGRALCVQWLKSTDETNDGNFPRILSGGDDKCVRVHSATKDHLFPIVPINCTDSVSDMVVPKTSKTAKKKKKKNKEPVVNSDSSVPSSPAANAILEYLSGNVSQSFRTILDSNSVNLLWVCLSATAGPDIWSKSCASFLQQDSTDPVTSAAILCSLGRPQEAIQTLCAKSDYKMALFLAEHRFGRESVEYSSVLQSWADSSVAISDFNQLASSLVLQGKVSTAIEVLLTRDRSLAALRRAVDLADTADLPCRARVEARWRLALFSLDSDAEPATQPTLLLRLCALQRQSLRGPPVSEESLLSAEEELLGEVEEVEKEAMLWLEELEAAGPRFCEEVSDSAFQETLRSLREVAASLRSRRPE